VGEAGAIGWCDGAAVVLTVAWHDFDRADGVYAVFEWAVSPTTHTSPLRTLRARPIQRTDVIAAAPRADDDLLPVAGFMRVGLLFHEFIAAMSVLLIFK